MAHGLKQSYEEMTKEDQALFALFRQMRGSYTAICRVLVKRGILAEMPKDLDKPIKI